MGDIHKRVWVCGKCGMVRDSPLIEGYDRGEGYHTLENYMYTWLVDYCFGSWIEVDTNHKGVGSLLSSGPIECVWPKGVPKELVIFYQPPRVGGRWKGDMGGVTRERK
jgi:hypothetical protein